MKKSGIINAELAAACARLGHTDLFAVADCGLPVPSHVPVIDLALVRGVPRFAQVLDAVLADVVLEAHWVASEASGVDAGAWLDARAGQLGERHIVSHEELKQRLVGCRFVVRTGEASPFANIILRSGVSF